MFNRFLTSIGAASIFLLASCSTQQLARQNEQNDDVYYSKAKAIEQEEELKKEKSYVTDQELYGDQNSSYTNSSDYEEGFYDGSYSARLYRFNNYTPWRSYYDSYYDYRFDPYYNNNFYSNNYYNSYYNRPAFGIYIGIGNPYGYNYYNPWNFYGSQYYGSYWGPYSYYNVYNPYYGGYSYYGGNYGRNGRPVVTNPNYRTRPNRETENIRSGVYNPDNDRIGTTPSRPQRTSTSPRESGTTTERTSERSQPVRISRPSRSEDGRSSGSTTKERSGNSQAPTEVSRPSRPQREDNPPQRTESRPAERQSSPPASTPSRSSEDNNKRPSRSGGR